jgi:Pyruvate/2-oxoacid:ferredoxin oxidoreductase delta subunit
MADIIEFDKRAENFRAERGNAVRRRKIEALRKIFQCTRCVVKCSKCGTQIDSESKESAKFAAPYSFCKSCGQEYEEYRARAGGNRADSECYWHNSTWMAVWETWLQHQQSLDRYRQSKEFLQLIDEVEHLLKK